MYRGTFRRGKAPCQRLKGAGTMAGSCLRHCRRQLPFALRLGAKPRQPPRGLPRFYTSLRERDFSSRTRRDEKMIWLLSAAGGGGNQERASAPSWTLPGTVGRGTGVPGRLPAAVRGACCPARRGAALPARGPLRRRDEGRGTGADAPLRAGDEGRGTGADAPLRAGDEGREIGRAHV